MRGTVRSQDKADAWTAKCELCFCFDVANRKLTSSPSDPEHTANIEWAIVKELADDGAFDEAIKGVDAVAQSVSSSGLLCNARVT